MIIVKNEQQKHTDVKNNYGSLLYNCLACNKEVANGTCGHRVKQPPYTSELKITSFASKFQFVIKKNVTEFLTLGRVKARTVLCH